MWAETSTSGFIEYSSREFNLKLLHLFPDVPSEFYYPLRISFALSFLIIGCASYNQLVLWYTYAMCNTFFATDYND